MTLKSNESAKSKDSLDADDYGLEYHCYWLYVDKHDCYFMDSNKTPLDKSDFLSPIAGRRFITNIYKSLGYTEAPTGKNFHETSCASPQTMGTCVIMSMLTQVKSSTNDLK